MLRPGGFGSLSTRFFPEKRGEITNLNVCEITHRRIADEWRYSRHTLERSNAIRRITNHLLRILGRLHPLFAIIPQNNHVGPAERSGSLPSAPWDPCCGGFAVGSETILRSSGQAFACPFFLSDVSVHSLAEHGILSSGHLSVTAAVHTLDVMHCSLCDGSQVRVLSRKGSS